MIKKLFILIVLLSFFANAFAADIAAAANSIKNFGTVENTAKALCLDKKIKNFNFANDYQQICKIVKESELCKKVSNAEKIECNDIKENELDVTSLSFIYNCTSGLWNSLKDLVTFIVDGAKGILGYTFDSEKRDSFHKAVGQYYDSFSNYLMIEFDKERDKTDSDFKAISNVAGGLIKTLMSKLGEVIKENYFNLGCYNQEARQERVCKIVGDIIMPPAAAIGLIFKGSKYGLKTLELSIKKADQTIAGLKKEKPIKLKKEKALNKELSELDLKSIENLSDKNIEDLTKFSKGLTASELENFKKVKLRFEKDFNEISKPNSLFFSVKDEMRFNQDEAFKNLLDYYSIVVKNGSSAEKFKKYNQWVKSDAHALFLYDQISKEGLTKNKDLLRYLTSFNDYFKKAHGLRGPPNSLITYSFEKESSKSEISLWFKKYGMSDDDWFKLTEEERLEIIKDLTDVKKDKVSDLRIASTGLKPHYVGDYSQELGHGFQDKSYGWEIANKKYEISLDRTLDEIKDVSKAFKETHSFHTHIVFDIPKNYKEFDKFQVWSKGVNDYLYLKGMEEGLHGNYLTGVAHLSEDAPERVDRAVNNYLPLDLRFVEKTSHKFFSMGIRAKLYGDSPVAGAQKLGLELRDTTRNLDVLSDHMKTITSSVQDYRWEKWDSNLDRKKVSFVRPNYERLNESMGHVVSESFLKRLHGGDINATIPLQKFENGEYFDFKTGKTITPTKEQQERITKAREYYLDEMKKIDKSLQEMDKKGESYAQEDVDGAIKMTMSEWAKMARVSELFQGY